MENKKVSGFWYIVPIFFGIIGGLIAWAVNKDVNRKKAVSFLWIGGVITAIVIGLLFLLVIAGMSSLDKARDVAKDANIMSGMMQLRSLSEIEYAMNLSYEDVSCSLDQVAGVCEDLERLTGRFPVIHTSTDEYCAYAQLGAGYACIDSEGALHETDVYPGESGYCNGVTFFCPPAI